MIRKSIPFSYQVPVAHTQTELSMTHKVLLVEGFAKLTDDPNDNLPPSIHADVDQIFVGQEEIKGTLEILGGMDKIQAEADSHAKNLFK